MFGDTLHFTAEQWSKHAGKACRAPGCALCWQSRAELDRFRGAHSSLPGLPVGRAGLWPRHLLVSPKGHCHPRLSPRETRSEREPRGRTEREK